MRNRINRRKFLLYGSATLASTIVLRRPLFKGKPANAAGMFKVRLVNPAKNLDRTFNVDADSYILVAAQSQGINLRASCRMGSCSDCAGKSARTYDVSGYAPGVYFVVLEYKEMVKSVKFLKK